MKKTYTFEQTFTEDGKSKLVRTNDGFNPIELLGLLEMAKDDVVKQITGIMPEPDIIERKVIVDKKNECNDLA